MISPPAEVRRDAGGRFAYLAALAVGFAAMLIADLPGHLTLDSVLELYEGRFRVRQSWAPSFYAWVLGRFDAVAHGTSLYVIASGLLLFGALASLPWLLGRASRWAALAALLFAASPLSLIYQGIVWKDVLFANAAIAGMICLAWAVKPEASRWVKVVALTKALLLVSAAALLRQNGVLVGAFAAAALGVCYSRGGFRRGIAWGLGAILAIVATSHALNLATQPPGRGGDGMSEGMRVLQTYDLLGAAALDPGHPLEAIARARPQSAATVARLAPRYWSAERTDYTDAQPQIGAAMAAVPASAIASDWRDLILKRPALYLRQRVAVFGWVFLTPQIDRCLPVALGLQGPDDVMAELGLKPRWSSRDVALLHYDNVFLKTPVHSHLAYALIAVVLSAGLLIRRRPQDLAVAAMLAASLAFAASFFLISIACDYRYLYLLDLAAMCAVLYVALDPRIGPRTGSRL